MLNAGCFAAGTKLLTRSGWRTVETICPGDEVLSRSEHDWSAQAEWKVVEERFERTGCILHVHVGGQVIRTTPEHPFFVQGEGWKQAGALANGDRIATLSGEWVAVEEVFDTREWEPVYNLRVADHHTCFVGDEGWGFAAWAQNAYFYHATSRSNAASIVANGQNPAFFGVKKDFGKGVYTTRLLQQAVDWAKKNADGGAIVKYSVSDADFATLTNITFTSASQPDWQETVREGRVGILDETPLPGDIAEGPVLKNWRMMTTDPASAILEKVKPIILGPH